MAYLHQWRMGEVLVAFLILMAAMGHSRACCSITGSGRLMRRITRINEEGPFLRIVIPNLSELIPLLQSSSFVPDPKLPYLDILGKRFRFGRLEDKKVIMATSGAFMLNAGTTTQLLLTLFRIEGIVHYGIAGNANPGLQIGDVTIPRYWAHTGLWTWQRYGDGPDDDLPTGIKTIGYLNISDYNAVTDSKDVKDNYLNNVWYEPEEILPINGIPEEIQHAFWVPVDKHYLAVSEKLKDLNLTQCVNATTCLPRAPVVARVERGVTANIFLDNKAYRKFLYSKFNATPVEMETAAIALICYQLKVPFIAIRSLSDLAGGGSSLSNEAAIFGSLAAKNAVDAVIRFVRLLGS